MFRFTIPFAEKSSRDLIAMCAVQAEFANNFFLHLAYNPDLAKYLALHTRGA
jgi:hypothetical protein